MIAPSGFGLMMDSLSEILQHISIDAEVFFSGRLCEPHTIGGDGRGNLHMLKSGVLTLITELGHSITVDKPSILYIPGPTTHRVLAAESKQPQLVCASISMHSAHQSQLVAALPQLIHIETSMAPAINRAADWIFDEAFNERDGRGAMLDKLSDIFLLQILRYVSGQGTLAFGLLAGLSHPQLSVAIKAISAQPDNSWSLVQLANLAAMSRSKFAAVFRDTVGQTPNDFITDLRIALAQDLLKKNRPVNFVANRVGYEHSSALAKIFKKKLGLSPKEWLLNLRKSQGST